MSVSPHDIPSSCAGTRIASANHGPAKDIRPRRWDMLPTQHLPHKRLLVVEDCFLARERMSLLLGEEGYMVSTAANGAEAIERLRNSSRPDLILLDLRMP